MVAVIIAVTGFHACGIRDGDQVPAAIIGKLLCPSHRIRHLSDEPLLIIGKKNRLTGRPVRHGKGPFPSGNIQDPLFVFFYLYELSFFVEAEGLSDRGGQGIAFVFVAYQLVFFHRSAHGKEGPGSFRLLLPFLPAWSCILWRMGCFRLLP